MRFRQIAAAFWLHVLCLPGALAAQSEPQCSDSIHSSFDFWIGSWEVRRADGSLVGHNTIRRTAGSCALAESWRGVRGNRGESLNFVDPADGRWQQIWVDNTGLVLRLAGRARDGAMMMEGIGRDAMRLQRITWTPLDDGRVRQLWQVSEPEGTGWTTVFDGYYARLPEPEPAAAARCDTPQGHRFDFWPGEWRVRSRLRQSDGEWHATGGTWRAEAVLGGCGFLDFTTGDFGQGLMSGVGSRFYDPERDVWVLTWASTLTPGKLGIWEGKFGSGDGGEFFRTEQTADGPVLSRIRWLNVRGGSADWDFSISSDDGREWQVLWRMEFERLVPSSR